MADKSEQSEHSVANESGGQNNVDISESRIQKEIQSLADDEKLALDPIKETDGVEDINAPEVPPVDMALVTKDVGGLIAKGVFYGAKFLKPGWNILAEEASSFGDAWAKVVTKYVPMEWLRYIPGLGGVGEDSICVECDAFMITVEILQPRLVNPETMSETTSETKPEVVQETSQPGAMKDVIEQGVSNAG